MKTTSIISLVLALLSALILYIRYLLCKKAGENHRINIPDFLKEVQQKDVIKEIE